MQAEPTLHPRPDDRGRPVALAAPSTPSPAANWNDPRALATCVPDGALPVRLNGVAFAAWAEAPQDSAGWAAVGGTDASLAEPELACAPGKAAAAGVVIVEPDDRVWVVHPSNRFGGYAATFPKGRVEPGLSLQATAIREAFEESGLRVEITGLLGDFERSATTTRYYLARRCGGTPAAMGWESQAVSLVPRTALAGVLEHPNDAPLLAALERALRPRAGRPRRPEVRNEGGNLARVFHTLEGFYALHGHWPTRLQMTSDCYADLAGWHLTAVGFARLRAKLQVKVDAAVTLIASDETGRRFDYTNNDWEPAAVEPSARDWLQL